ncbi:MULTISPECIES: S9 family peptidase [unclassified Nocardia]|uniref:alpha/beta hydrolase family protein n=1 Tax=unclassified Nocardia TaxID=2637762 RepID=UPI001CE42D9B|nr:MULTISPECIES: lipase family protein [unclassified Nocardia]
MNDRGRIRRQSRRTAAAAALTTVAGLVCAAPTGAAPGTEPPGAAPAADGFYDPPANLVAGDHGSIIWSRPLSSDPALPGARNYLVLYRSVDAQGRTVAVSGTVAVPEGVAPEGGWPLISWAHGTTGVADICAPSRDTGPDFPSHDYTAPVRRTLARWIAAGYAVAQTDYQGLGTPGPHGYLIGETEQRAVADMAAAARQLDPNIGDRWVAMGHSQGGQAAIFTDARAQQWVPGMHLLGAVALAPASHIGLGMRASQLATAAGSSGALGALAGGGATPFVPLFVRGAQTVADLDPGRFLTPRAQALLPLADRGCVGQLREPDEWGGLPGGEVFTPDADMSDLLRVLDENDPGTLTFGLPALVLQGRADTVVFPVGTDAMMAQLKATGQPVEYRTYPGVDHRGVVDASFDDALAWVNARFTR